MGKIGRTLRHSAVGLPAAAALGVVAAQAWYAGRRPLPEFPDLSPDIEVGAPGRPAVRLALVGDSTVTGPGLDDADHIWVRLVAERLTEWWRVEVRSHAVGGARARDVLRRQVPRVLADPQPDVTVVSVGANDAIRQVPLGRLEDELATIVDRLLTVSSAVVLAGVGDLGTAPRLGYPLRAIASARSRAADRIHARVAARSPRVFKVPVAEYTTHEFRRRRAELFCPDLFHPNREGHALWADAAFPVLVDALARATAEVPVLAAGR